jgi:hypothetical protein
MPTRHSHIVIGACSDPAYIPHHLLQQNRDRPKSRMEQLVDEARAHPKNVGLEQGGLLPHRIINQGPVFGLADQAIRSSVLNLNDVVLGATHVLLLDLHSNCAGVIARTELSLGDDQRDFQTKVALAYGQDFADSLAILGGHDVEVKISYTDFGADDLTYEAHDIAMFTAQSPSWAGRATIDVATELT